MIKEFNNNSIIEKKLAAADFSSECVQKNKNEMREHLLAQLTSGEAALNTAKSKPFNIRRLRPAAMTAAVLALCLSFSFMAYGESIIKVIQEFSVGRSAKFISTDTVPYNESLPDNLRGKLFDADGTVLSALPEDGVLFNENGEKVTLVYDASTNSVYIVTLEELAASDKMVPRKVVFETIDDIKSSVAFDFLMPSFLPNDYTFEHAELITDENGQIRSKEDNTSIYYYLTNSDHTKRIIVSIRLLDGQTTFESYGTKYMKEITINGYPGVMDVNNLNVEINGVLYSFYSNDRESNGSELIKLAESMK